MFFGREVLIATKHKKEIAIGPVLQHWFGLKWRVPEDFDTDLLGTFTGEIERRSDALSVARTKCIMAAERYGADLILASEGSFGPHPSLFFVSADTEILYLYDLKNKLEIHAVHVSTKTNFFSEEVSSWEELKEHAMRVGFPDHGLILKDQRNAWAEVVKGITDEVVLKKSFDRMIKQHGKVHLETDMRALYNPTRMKVIEETTVKLVEKMKAPCPRCGVPGFSISSAFQGLPCEMCHRPTRSIIHYKYECSNCNYHEVKEKDGNKQFEEAMYCDFCNP